jgi:flagellar motor switch protein FliM
MEMDIHVVFSMIDRLLGGPGQATAARRADLTDIEKTLANQIIQRGLRELKNAWESVVSLEPQVDGIETSAQFVQIVPPNDTVVLLLFQIKVGDVQGAMTLCLPYVSLKPIASKLSAQRWFASTGKKTNDPAHARQLAQLIQGTRVPCVARLGTAQITVEELLRLAPGDTIVTDTPYGGDVDILVGKNVKFRAQAGTQRRKMVVRIQSVVERDADSEDPLAPWR